MGKSLVVVSPAAASVFAGVKTRAILFALMGEQQSLQSLHRRLGFSLSLLHYHVARLQRLGLVAISDRVVRPGRPITIYAATAGTFIVPAALSASSAAVHRRRQLDGALQRARSRHAEPATVYDLAADGAPRIMRLPVKGQVSAGGEWWWRLNLTEPDARVLASELRAVIARYQASARAGGKAFTGYLALAPV